MDWNLPYGLEHYFVIKHVSYGHCFRYRWNAGMPSEPENIYWLSYRAGPWCTTQYSRPGYKEWLTFHPTVKCVPHIRKLLSWMLQFRPTKTHPYVRNPLNSLHSTHLKIHSLRPETLHILCFNPEKFTRAVRNYSLSYSSSYQHTFSRPEIIQLLILIYKGSENSGKYSSLFLIIQVLLT